MNMDTYSMIPSECYFNNKQRKRGKNGEGFVNISNKIKARKNGNIPMGETSKKDSNSFQALVSDKNHIENNKGLEPGRVSPKKIEETRGRK
jgi:hypothetical protein